MSLDICVHAVHAGQPATPKVSLEDDGYYLLADLRTMIDHAERCGGPIECIGD
jgi:hypothetical protein